DTVDANPQLEGMGTTLTAVLFSGSKIGMVHIGDSRAYMVRNGEFAQITKDDTYVQMLVDEGRISPEEASSHPQRSLLTRALDGRDIDPEYSVRQVLKGDRYLICSDGLSGVVSSDTIGECMRGITDPQECTERLVQLALRGGGPDNVTVVVADATDADIVEQAPIVGGAAARDRGNTTVADSSSAAARAAALRESTRPQPSDGAADEREEPEPKRHPVRTSLLVLVLLAVLGGGLYTGWRYTQDQYYVGATDAGQLAIFRGVPGQIAGLDLSSVNEEFQTKLNDLTPVAQERVKQGIQARNRTDAKERLADLTLDVPSNPNLKPICGTTGAVPSGAASALPSTSASLSTSAPPRTPATTAPATSADARPTDPSAAPVDPVGCRQVD
ncbi:MAG: family protein phosphatase, partial [Actinoplanes sp.]|nr:family protein phosphatase [Actinoplanes sp.]